MNFTFVVSGKLWRNSMVMQDEETESLWSHLTGEALDGLMADQILELLPAVQTTWGEWVAEHPDTRLLRKEEAVTASHYQRYFDDPDRLGLFRTDWLTARMPGKDRVHGVVRGPLATSIADRTLAPGSLFNTELGEEGIVFVRGQDGGPRAYLALVTGRKLTFKPGTELTGVVDVESGSTWDMDQGLCVAGALKGSALEELVVQTAFWFAWSAFYPNTEVIE